MDDLRKEDVIDEAYRYKGLVLSYALGFLRSHADSEDVVQEVFIVISNKWDTYRKGTRITSWMLKITKLKCLEFLRKRKRDRVVIDSEAFPEGYEELWNHEALDRLNLMKDALRECVSHLSDEGKQLIHNFYFKGYSCNKLAEISQQSPDYQRNHLYRIRTRLRKCINSKIDTPEPQISSDANTEIDALDLHFGEFAVNNLSEPPKVDLEGEEKQRQWIQYLLEWTALALVSQEIDSEANCPTEKEQPPLESFQRNETMSVFPETSANVEKRTMTRWAYGAAAMLFIAIGMYFTSLRKETIHTVAHISDIKGESWILQDSGEAIRLSKGHAIQKGDQLYTKDNSRVQFAYPGEKTYVWLGENSRIEVAKDKQSSIRKELTLLAGNILCEVDKQPADHPMIVNTNEAEVTVLGTRFKLISNPGKTTLTMLNGTVRMKNKKSGQVELVSNEQEAKVFEHQNKIWLTDNKVAHTDKNENAQPRVTLNDFRLETPLKRLTAQIQTVEEELPFQSALHISAAPKQKAGKRAAIVFPIKGEGAPNQIFSVSFSARTLSNTSATLGVFLKSRALNNFTLTQSVNLQSLEWKEHLVLVSAFEPFVDGEIELTLVVNGWDPAEFQIGNLVVNSLGDTFEIDSPMNRNNFKVTASSNTVVKAEPISISTQLDGWTFLFDKVNRKKSEIISQTFSRARKGDRFLAILPHHVAKKEHMPPVHFDLRLINTDGQVIAEKSIQTKPTGHTAYPKVLLTVSEFLGSQKCFWKINVNSKDNKLSMAVPLLIRLDERTDTSKMPHVN